MPERVPRVVQVKQTQRLSESLVRVVMTGEALAGFDPVHTDSYVKLCYPEPDAGPDDRPRMRTYTVRAFEPDVNELTIDFVVHGTEGLAGPWAAAAQPGDEVLLLGPGGDYDPAPDAAFHLLAGDESALPAIAVALERLPPDVAVQAFVEVHGPGDEIELARPDDVTWLHRGAGEVGSRLVEAVTAWPLPADAVDGHWFVHGEAAAVRTLRRHLRTELGVPMDRLSISGYWRLGVDDEGWRAVKRDWNRQIAETEATLA